MKRKLSAMMATVLVGSLLCTGASAAQTYTVKRGDAMWKIAAKYGVSLQDIIKANPQVENPNLIYPGDVLNVPDSGASAASQPAASQPAAEQSAEQSAAQPAVQAKPGVVASLTGTRVEELPGYETVEVPANVFANYKSDAVKNYIQEFANFTQIPRPSFHTSKMTKYLEVWADTHGIDCVSDEMGNVVMNVPATAGYEDSPIVIFQGHIDLVPAADPGVEHDWENDPLDLLWTTNSVKADGTSLGADNGSGVAFMLTYMDYADELVHGPLRFIFTVDEEVGLYGAHALDNKHLDDATYMVNVDGGYGGATISCAGGCYFDFSHKAEWVAVPAGSTAFELEFAGLKGGHSASVGGGKANGLVAMANAILSLDQAGLEFNVVNIEGGSASNAIPNSSKALITVKSADLEKVNETLAALAKKFKDSYGATETDYTFTYGASDQKVEKVLDGDLSVKLVQLMSSVPNNIHTLMTLTSGTEASSNLGVFSLTDDTVSFTCMMRSASTYQAAQITMTNYALAEMSGFDVDVPTTFAAWPMKAENDLADIAAALFKEMTGEEYALKATHGGVECGEFSEKNENLLIISTGVSGGSNGHTPQESMNFDKVELSMEFLTALATRLAQQK